MTTHQPRLQELLAVALAAVLPGIGAAGTLVGSAFDGNTGAHVFAASTDNVAGSATLTVSDWTTHPSVASISGLTAISTGDSGTLGGFAQTQNGSGAYANPDCLFISRNHNQDSDRTSSRRGFSLEFAVDAPWELATLTVASGHTTNTGNSDQAYASDLVFVLSGGSLAEPVTALSSEDYNIAPAYHTVVFDLAGATIEAGTYTLEVYQTNMTGGGAYAVFDGITLEGSPAADADGDGLNDFWEIEHFGDITSQDGTGDPDVDGSDNEQEETRLTDPNDEDTDDDGFHDGAETGTGTFISYDYNTHAGDTGTDPLDQDSDDDILPDGAESNTGTFVSLSDTGTDPNLPDSDFDTLPDGWEAANGLDPTTDAAPNGDIDDPDEDSLLNYEEFDNGTHPLLADTDDDGVEDPVELFTDFTDPLDPDSDDDGLDDGGEKNAGTDPRNPDSDGDLYSDGAEVAAGSDPTLASSLPAYSVLSSNFDANTGATVLDGDTDNVSGSASLEVAWVSRSTVTTVSGLTAICDGDGGALGGFAQTQGGTATYANPDTVFLSRNHNLDTDRTTSRRGFGFDFTIDSPVALGTLTVRSGHTNNTGNQDQAYQSDLVFVLSGGSLASPLAGTATEDYALPPAYHAVVFDLGGMTVGAGTYTLEVYQTNMTGGGAYATFGGLSLDEGTPAASAPRIVGAAFNGTAFDMQVTGLDTSTTYLLMRSESLADDFPAQIGDPFTPASTSAVVTDPAPAGPRGFYRIEQAP